MDVFFIFFINSEKQIKTSQNADADADVNADADAEMPMPGFPNGHLGLTQTTYSLVQKQARANACGTSEAIATQVNQEYQHFLTSCFISCARCTFASLFL